MADLDALFKKPALPSSSSSKKRKLAPTADPLASYKSAKLSPNGTRAPSVVDAPEEADAADTSIPDASSSLPADFFDAPAEDEEGGRFFGGGTSSEQDKILDFMDAAEETGVAAEESIDSTWLRKKALAFEKKISKNAEHRGKFEDEPHRFMESEEALDTEIKSWSILAEHPELFAEFRKVGSLGSLVGLLAHENSDVVVDVVQVLAEMTDEDVEAEAEQWNELVEGMVEADCLELLTATLDGLNESNEGDRAGVYHTLSVFENLASLPSLSTKMVQTTLLPSWLLKRIQTRESPISQNKQYSAELLSILLQTPANRDHLCTLDAADTFLTLLSPYRKRDPVKGGDEEEFVENIFDSLTALVDSSAGKRAFVAAEGVELALIMLREGKMAKPRALRLLDHAVSSTEEYAVAERLVEAAGLKTIFGHFMKKTDPRSIEHIIGILASLLRLLPTSSAARIRTLAKFVERDYEKLSRLLAIRGEYAPRVKKAALEIEREIQERGISEEERAEFEEEWMGRRLDAGLYAIQLCDLCVGWLCVEDAGAKGRIKELMGAEGIEEVKGTLEESMRLLESEVELTDEQTDTKRMLEALVSYL